MTTREIEEIKLEGSLKALRQEIESKLRKIRHCSEAASRNMLAEFQPNFSEIAQLMQDIQRLYEAWVELPISKEVNHEQQRTGHYR